MNRTALALRRFGVCAVALATAAAGAPLLIGSAASAQSVPDILNPTSTTTPSRTATATPQVTTTATTTASPIATTTASATTAATPTATGSVTVTPTPTGTGSASASTSPTASASATGSGGATAPTQQLTLRVTSPSTITPGQGSVLRATGQPSATVTLRCYSRPSTEYVDARPGSIGSDGEIEFRLNPGTNTRCFVKYSGTDDADARNSASVVQNVATALSLTVVRNGTRDYTFQGRILPRRAGQLITLYRVDPNGREVLTAQVKTDSSGTWRIRRAFSGSGRFGFVARTGQNLTNVAGRSNTRTTLIY